MHILTVCPLYAVSPFSESQQYLHSPQRGRPTATHNARSSPALTEQTGRRAGNWPRQESGDCTATTECPAPVAGLTVSPLPPVPTAPPRRRPDRVPPAPPPCPQHRKGGDKAAAEGRAVVPSSADSAVSERFVNVTNTHEEHESSRREEEVHHLGSVTNEVRL